ncbi:MAG: hypothetical protein PUF61_10675 [Spirochaetales bacterium]|nr:hypothetical protein [Spirochaetales bacterium]
MKRFIIKIISLSFIITALLLIYALPQLYYDTFNVFHWKNRRFIQKDEPNKNFIKTKYILSNPSKFNSFIFGSSRVQSIPPTKLPKQSNKTQLHWYNMSYPEGIPAEHLMTIKTFLENGVEIKMILLGFDNISMFASISEHEKKLMQIPYQIYEKNKYHFYKPYLLEHPPLYIMKEVHNYNKNSNLDKTKIFYDIGIEKYHLDFSLTQNPNMEYFEYNHFKTEYTQKNAHNDIAELVHFCKKEGIELILFTNPIYETTYKDAVEQGYFDFLRKVAQNCEFYNFSSLNNFTTNPAYYFEWSHYRPALGLIIEKMLFGTEEEKAEIRKEADDEVWGIKINSENIDYVIQKLQEQLELYTETLEN